MSDGEVIGEVSMQRSFDSECWREWHRSAPGTPPTLGRAVKLPVEWPTPEAARLEGLPSWLVRFRDLGAEADSWDRYWGRRYLQSLAGHRRD